MSENELIGLGGAGWRDRPDDREETEPGRRRGPTPVNIRNFSVKCGHCGNYQVIVSFRRVDDDWNEYVYECDEPPCTDDVTRSRTVLEVPVNLDEFARRDPAWHGGEVHAGAKHGHDE